MHLKEAEKEDLSSNWSKQLRATLLFPIPVSPNISVSDECGLGFVFYEFS